MTYGAEVISRVEVGLPSLRHIHFNDISNDELRRCGLDFLVEKRNDSQAKMGHLPMKDD